VGRGRRKVLNSEIFLIRKIAIIFLANFKLEEILILIFENFLNSNPLHALSPFEEVH